MSTTLVHRKTLTQMTEEYLALLNAMEDVCEGGEVDDEAQTFLVEQMAAIEQELPTKMDGVLAVEREMASYADACQREADRLQARAARWKKQAAWLRERVLLTMQALNLPQIKTPTNTVSVVKNGGKQALVLPDHVDFIPAEYVVSRTILEPAKDKIREALEKGTDELKAEVGKFASLQERGVYLRIS